MLTGIEFAEVRDVIARAFNGDDFDMFLYERLNFNRPDWVADGPFKVVVTNVLKQFEMDGRDAHLIAEIAAVRPLKAEVQGVYKKYAMSLLDETLKRAVTDEQQQTLARYGLAPTVDLQRGGKAQLPTQTATRDAFQRQVKVHLPNLDMRVWMAEALKNEERVCRIEVDSRGVGTGFLVGPGAVLTNHHVLKEYIAAKADSTNIQCRFGYRVRPNGQEEEGTLVPLKRAFADWHIDSTPGLTGAQELAGVPEPSADQLDHAVLRLDRDYGAEPIYKRLQKDGKYENGPTRGWVRVPEGAPPLAPNDALLIVQHPRGVALKLAMDTNAILSVKATRIRYTTNTDPGSSGSPCFNIGWSPVALHHVGDTAHDRAEFNQGVPLHLIRARLRKLGKEKNVLGDESPE
jgi:hypothetical protein